MNHKQEAKILKKLNNIKNFSANEIGEIVFQEAKIVAKEMKNEVPVDTGRLQRNIEAKRVGKNKTRLSSKAIDPETKFDYSVVINEYGGRYAKGQFYFYNGRRRLIDRVQRRAKAEGRNIIRGKAGSTRQRGNIRDFTPRK